MALTPTEREEHFFKAMVDAADGSTPEELEPTERREHWYKEIIDAIKSGGGGSGGGVLVVHEVGGALDKTYKQIVDALHANGVILEWTNETGMIEVYMVVDYGKVDDIYSIAFHTDSVQASAGGKSHYYIAESENGYPTNDD